MEAGGAATASGGAPPPPPPERGARMRLRSGGGSSTRSVSSTASWVGPPAAPASPRSAFGMAADPCRRLWLFVVVPAPYCVAGFVNDPGNNSRVGSPTRPRGGGRTRTRRDSAPQGFGSVKRPRTKPPSSGSAGAGNGAGGRAHPRREPQRTTPQPPLGANVEFIQKDEPVRSVAEAVRWAVVSLVASRDIRPGEELYAWYGRVYDWANPAVQCTDSGSLT